MAACLVFVLSMPQLHPCHLHSAVCFTLGPLGCYHLLLQVPVIQVLLGNLGLITSKQMFSQWRFVVVGATIAAAVLTPSTDPFAQTLLAVPLICRTLMSESTSGSTARRSVHEWSDFGAESGKAAPSLRLAGSKSSLH